MNSVASICVMMLAVLVAIVNSDQDMKGSFYGLGCKRGYDKAKFAILDGVCEECYQLFRDPEVHTVCRYNCFKNVVFARCVDSLFLEEDQQQLDSIVDELYGKRR